MGRTEPSKGLAPPPQRRNQRAKRARETLNRTIPTILASDSRARAGVQAVELIVDPPPHDVELEAGRNTTEAPLQKRHRKERLSKYPPTREHEQESSKNSIGGALVHPDPHSELQTASPNVKVLVADALTAASLLTRVAYRGSGINRLALGTSVKRTSLRKNVAILNMASPLRPGGGFLNGATSQEEFLCMRTTLLPSLREEFYRLPEVGAVWTSDVLVFRQSGAEALELPRKDRFYVDVISAGAFRMPETVVRSLQTNSGVDSRDDEWKGAKAQNLLSEKDAALLRRKMRALLRILQCKGSTKVVLGAWGCGAYGNPLGEVARAWRDVLLGKPSSKQSRQNKEIHFGLEEILFAIDQQSMAAEFARHWGDNLEVETLPSARPHEDEDDATSEQDTRVIEELRQKIAQLDAQIAGARTETLKSGLETVRRKLAHELAAELSDDSDGVDSITSESFHGES